MEPDELDVLVFGFHGTSRQPVLQLRVQPLVRLGQDDARTFRPERMVALQFLRVERRLVGIMHEEVRPPLDLLLEVFRLGDVLLV